VARESLQVGCGAGFSNDRPEGGVGLTKTFVANGRPAALLYETLAERTLALAQLAKRQDPSKGYEPQLTSYLAPVLSSCLANRIPIIGNFGAANPRAAAKQILSLARDLRLEKIRIGVIDGDDLLENHSPEEIMKCRNDVSADLLTQRMISANVYLGAEPIARALEGGTDVIVTGRVADPSLALGPLVHHFGWDWDDWDRLAAGTLAGHLLECGAQVTGGYFADPGFKDVPEVAWVGFPIAEMESDGRMVITKATQTGGLVSKATVIEQILYEIHDPSAYLTPDVVLDITNVTVHEIGEDRVSLQGAKGKPRPDLLKGIVGFSDGWLGEGEISYAGPNALARARLAVSILKERMKAAYPDCLLRGDIIGACSVFNDDAGAALDEIRTDVPDARARVAVHSMDLEVAEMVRKEVAALYCCGPAGGGGIRTAVTPRVATASVFVPRGMVKPRVSFVEIKDE